MAEKAPARIEFEATVVEKYGSLAEFYRLNGLKAAAKNKQMYGSDFYKSIGKLGGLKSRGGGFAANPELARLAGAKGGSASRRRKGK